MRSVWILSLCLSCLPLCHAPTAPDPLPPPAEARPWPEWDARFQQSEGWIGADGAYSVPVTPERTLWLFSDTWVGKVRDGKRTDVTMVNNTIGVQDGHGEQAKMHFVVRYAADGKPTAIITPDDGKGWYWLQGGIVISGKLYMFLAQIERTGDGAFGFRQIGETLGVVENPGDDPTEWRIEQKKIPFSDFAGRRFLSYGAAVLAVGDEVYVYGTDETQGGSELPNKHLVVARVKAASLADFSSWRFFDNGRWESDFQKAEHIAEGVANELSVSYQTGTKQYILVYTDHGLSDKIMARVSKTPHGPWSDSTVLYRSPEMKEDKKVFTYAAKAHAGESKDNELMITYVVNSFDFLHVMSDARLYWPKVVRVRLQAGAD